MYDSRGRSCSFAYGDGDIPGLFKQPVKKARVCGLSKQMKDGQNVKIVPKSEPTTAPQVS